MDIKIRKPEPGEERRILALMQDFAEFEGLSEFLLITEEKLRQAIFGEGTFVEALVAEVEDEIVGYSMYYPRFASFRGQNGFYLEDIYIDRTYRGRRVGEAMLKEIAKIAASRGFERIDFQVLEWNESAINFYFGLGAVSENSDKHLMFLGDAFADLAS